MPSFDQALAVLQRMQRRFGNSVAAFELMWDNFVQASVQWQHLQAPFAERHPLPGADRCGWQRRSQPA